MNLLEQEHKHEGTDLSYFVLDPNRRISIKLVGFGARKLIRLVRSPQAGDGDCVFEETLEARQPLLRQVEIGQVGLLSQGQTNHV